MKKILFLAISIFVFYNQSLQAISISYGIPSSHNINGFVYDEVSGIYGKQSYGNVVDKTNGFFLGILSTYDIGFGIDSYTTKFKTGNCKGCWAEQYDAGLKTKMTNIFYQLPIRMLNIIVGVGMGNTEYDCTVCSSYYKKGSASQWYSSFGFQIMGSLDIHISYRSITANKIINKYTDKIDDNSGKVIGIGFALKLLGEGEEDDYGDEDYDDEE
tara:strand:- start:130 stop:771 length:642 start_codon:yes stop_codon:yes gene_type:complete